MLDKEARMASTAMAVAGRASRACDVCGRKRARWYCAADEAYLCEGCDSSVHAANALALRHERVRLAPNGAPMKMDRRNPAALDPSSTTAGPRKKIKVRPSMAPALHPKPLSPEDVGASQLREVKVELSSEPSDHFTAEELTGNANLLDSPPNCPHSYGVSTSASHPINEADFAHDFLVSDPSDENQQLPSEACCEADEGIGSDWIGSGEMASGGDGVSELDFCADRDLSDDDYCLDMVALRGSVSGIDQNSYAQLSELSGSSRGKPFKSIAGNAEWIKTEVEGWNECDMRQVPSLRLDYADVLNSWSDRGTLWTEDHNPQLVPDDSNSDVIGNFDLGLVPDLSITGQVPMFGCVEDNLNVSNGREARVIRYREKRRTRLFSKKIRYEVRKLNAERRPRMKGRFVKRSPGRE